MEFTYAQITALLSTTQELNESKEYYTDCITATKELISVIDKRLLVETYYDLAKLKVERCETISKQKAYESYLSQKLQAIDRNKQIEELVTAERKEFMPSLVERAELLVKAKPNAEISDTIEVYKTNFDNLEEIKKDELYLRLQLLLENTKK